MARHVGEVRTLDSQELITRYQAGERDFTKVDLRGADLHETNLSEADLSGADLRGVDLSGADLQATVLKGAKCNRRTRWPDDFPTLPSGVMFLD
jgi:uncharacterized protein YjbI with pentapeptide repeats